MLSRTFATTAVRLKNPETEGHVFTAKLFDIVKLYNTKGKGLFDKNIRMGIEDVLNVDVAINETLENAPSEFWYLNNGITILVEKGNLDLRKNDQITLKDNVYSKLGLTVINGAQTINSAARFFYKREENDSVRINAEKNAYVMLKVVEINSSLGKAQNNDQDNAQENDQNNDQDNTQENDQNNDQSNAHDANKLHERINQITISLNRQKPVVIEDIAYTLPVINFINELKYKFDEVPGLAEEHPELRKLLFNIVRRGEVAVVEKQRYTLKILPRILMTILLNKPGKARTAGLKTLIKINSEGNHFEDRDLFPIFERTESGNAEQANNNAETVDPNLLLEYEFFKKNYAAVNFSMQLYEKLETYAEKKDLFENELGPSQIHKYGKYLMIYTIVQALKYLSMNEEGTLQVEDLENEKYLAWEYNNSHVSQFLTDDNYKNIVRILAEKWEEYHEVTGEENNVNHWDSNVFKKDEVVKVVAKESLEDIIALFIPLEDETTH